MESEINTTRYSCTRKLSFGNSKGKMPGNKGKQRRWGVDKHPIFAVLKADILAGIKVCLEIFKMDIL